MSRDLAQALHELWISMSGAMDQGHNHTIRVNPVMVEDVMAAEAIVRVFMASAERAEAERDALDHAFKALGKDMANLGRERDALREALERLVTDYEDVPDATDADGQDVFAKARAALAPSPAEREG